MASLQQGISTLLSTAADAVLQTHTWYNKDHSITLPNLLTPAPNSLPPNAGGDQTLSDDRHSPDGGVALPPSETILGNSAHPRRNTASDTPCRRANIRTRRSQHGAVLARSPARAGRAARMHQIFEDAGRGRITPAGAPGVLYPQLPNVSQRAPPLEHNQTRDASNPVDSQCSPRSRSPCRSADSVLIGTQVDPLPAYRLVQTERTSASWSDDSGYLISDTSRESGISLSPSQRIQDWLSAIDEAIYFDGTTKTKDAYSRQQRPPRVGHEVRNPVPVNKVELLAPPAVLDTSWMEATSSLQAGDAIEDPFVSNDLVHVRPTQWVLKKPCSNLRIPPIPTRFKEYIPNSDEPLHLDPAVSKATTKAENKADYAITPHWTLTRIDQQPKIGGVSADASAEDNGAFELSPLSPNVCIERGPSRYHASPKSPTITRAPVVTKERRPMIPRSTRFKENFDSSPPPKANAIDLQASSASLRPRN